MSGSLWLAAALLGTATLLMRPTGVAVGRLVRPAGVVSLATGSPTPRLDGDRQPVHGRPASRMRRNRAACVVAGIGCWTLFGGVAGIVLGLAVIAVGPLALNKLEPRSVRQRRLALESAAPMVADLMAACLASGASTAAATFAVSESLGEPIASVLGRCVAQIQLGADPVRVWGMLAHEPELAPIARAILRSADSGAPLADILLRTGDDLRSARRARLEAAARAAGIKAVGPLGVCFLPAFMLLGVVPLVASLVGRMLAQ